MIRFFASLRMTTIINSPTATQPPKEEDSIREISNMSGQVLKDLQKLPRRHSQRVSVFHRGNPLKSHLPAESLVLDERGQLTHPFFRGRGPETILTVIHDIPIDPDRGADDRHSHA